jgi:hypothetical protein
MCRRSLLFSVLQNPVRVISLRPSFGM